MAFTCDLARLVANQLSRFVTLNRHQLAGQVANLDFWIGEARHALGVIDGYGARFRRLRQAQTRHVKDHHTTLFALDDPCCTQSGPEPPRRTPDADLRDARRSLCEATHGFLMRCFHEGLFDEDALRAACESLGIGIDPADLRRRPKRPSTQS
jgi:hypothetical protein